MKSAIVTLLLLVCATGLLSAQVRFGLEGGLNMANLKVSYPGSTYSNKSRAGVRLGAILDCNVGKGLSIQPGLFFARNNGKVFGTDRSGSISQTYSISALELPLNVQYHASTGGGNVLFVGAGPFLAFHLSGKMLDDNYGLESRPLRIGSAETDDIKPVDFGLGLNAGFRFSSGLFFRLRYQVGLKNVTPFPDNDAHMKTRSFGLQVGYLFGGIHKKPQAPISQ